MTDHQRRLHGMPPRRALRPKIILGSIERAVTAEPERHADGKLYLAYYDEEGSIVAVAALV